jgi:hypothetical protein
MWAVRVVALRDDAATAVIVAEEHFRGHLMVDRRQLILLFVAMA